MLADRRGVTALAGQGSGVSNRLAVKFKKEDFNGAGAVFAKSHAVQWKEIDAALAGVTLHLKGSRQKGKIGEPVWDSVGNNAAIHEEFANMHKGWRQHPAIPPSYVFFGKHVDFIKRGVAIEVQFSNYPFLLNNVMRCEFFFKHGIALGGSMVDAVVIVTKTKMVDASNSSLYYERALEQLDALVKDNVFEVPLRLVGLYESHGPKVPVVWETYPAARSRTAVSRSTTAKITAGARPTSRAAIVVK